MTMTKSFARACRNSLINCTCANCCEYMPGDWAVHYNGMAWRSAMAATCGKPECGLAVEQHRDENGELHLN